MDLNQLLDNCITLEKIISTLIKINGSRKTELNRLQTLILDYSHSKFNELVEQEGELQTKLEALRTKKDEFDTDIRQFSDINDKLAEIVSITQKTCNDKTSANEKHDAAYALVAEAMQEFEHIKLEHLKTSNQINTLNETLKKNTQEVKEIIHENQELVNNLHKNDNIIRLLDQQNKNSEQQFDLILNQLPWEPLSENYLNELRNSSDSTVRDLAEVLQIQANEINELNESLNSKKRTKLEILEKLATRLNDFLRRRGEAVLMQH